MVEKTSQFFETYQSLKKALVENRKKLQPLSFEERKEIFSKIDEYKKAINTLIMEGSDVAFEQYAKKLFDMSLDIISTSLLNDAIKFDKLSDEARLNFAQTFITQIANRFDVVPNKVVYQADLPKELGGGYEHKNDNIYLNKMFEEKKYLFELQYFIGTLLHEFTHYLYVKYPEKSPVGKEKAIAAVMEDRTTGYRDLEDYKQKPFEVPAYYVQDYFEKHEFDKQLKLRIQKIKQSVDLGRS